MKPKNPTEEYLLAGQYHEAVLDEVTENEKESE